MQIVLTRSKTVLMNREEVLRLAENEETKKLYELLTQLRSQLSIAFAENHKRSLPFPDILFDRWERARELNFGEGTSVYDSCVILGNVKVGHNTWIGPYTVLDGSGNLEIGDNCSISAGVQIYSHDSVNWATSGGVAKYDYEKTVIGSNCYIGPNTIIAKGVTIGNGSVIGANSFVNRSFPEGSRIAGNPAQVLK